MDYIIKKEKNKHLIILVHGLNGSDKTWKGNKERFCENLIEENFIQDNFDLALFNYGTKILKVNWIARIIRLLKGFFSNKPKEESKKFNVSIDKVSMPLVAQLNGIQAQYDTISFITHSMGGLVTKNVLTWLDKNILEKIYFFMSLSVPHIGASLATIGSKLPVLGKNPQIIGLQAMGTFTTLLNQRFGNIKT
ncbi:esterase/lipase family protein [Tenacibaculum halocynthiae]|uniref:esterase/lipase family protein n=1 Tax=Tenacibaculum halocynthiae TaxID=1254437 RepID=UPI0038963322